MRSSDPDAASRRLEITDLATFPDATIVCGQRRLAAVDRNAVTNPTLLVEVTSASTEDYDRGDSSRTASGSRAWSP